MRELFMQAHEELIEEMLDESPEMDEDEVIRKTEGAAWERMIDKLSAIADSRPEMMT